MRKNKKTITKKVSALSSSGGVVYFLAMLFVGCAVFGFQYFFLKNESTKVSEALSQAVLEQAKVDNDLNSLSFFDQTSKKIKMAYESYAKAGAPLLLSDLSWATDVGMNEPVVSFNTAFKSPGFTLSSDQTEFMRFTSAISEAEALFPLLQFTQAALILPSGKEAMKPEPTFLTIRAECFSARK